MIVQNFGRNVRFEPALLLTPEDKNEIPALLEQHRGRSVRVRGSLHSWSDTAVGRDVVLDLRKLNRIVLHRDGEGRIEAEVEGGCTVDALLDYLQSHGSYTLPTYGVIGKQTIAGAIATATHGSGRSSLSHYVTAVTVAGYDPDSGHARLYEWHTGDALRAARCGLGCTGIVLSVRIQVEPDFLIEERTQWFDRIEPVLAQETAYPLQQFFLVPWSWRWFAQCRRQLDPRSGARPGAAAVFQRLFRLIGVDVVMNGVVRLLSQPLRWWPALRWFYRRLFPKLARPGARVVDDSRRLLMMRHDLYRYVELELFVPAPYVTHAAALVEWVLRRCGGESLPPPELLAADQFGSPGLTGIGPLTGSYVHDHLINFRRVLGDDALISMTSGDEHRAWYAVSLVTYQKDLAPFLGMAAFLSSTMAGAYGARPHWGKICTLTTAEMAALYAELPRFRAHCASVDPDQVFVNDFARRCLGF